MSKLPPVVLVTNTTLSIRDSTNLAETDMPYSKYIILLGLNLEIPSNQPKIYLEKGRLQSLLPTERYCAV